jgi:hypothetical protein
MGQAQSLLNRAIEELAVGLGKKTEPAASLVEIPNSGGISQALQDLESLLQHSDMDALEVFVARRSQLGGLPEELFDRLDQALHALDFEAAHKACLEAKKVFKA